jgi:hypothetical protein
MNRRARWAADSGLIRVVASRSTTVRAESADAVGVGAAIMTDTGNTSGVAAPCHGAIGFKRAQ